MRSFSAAGRCKPSRASDHGEVGRLAIPALAIPLRRSGGLPQGGPVLEHGWLPGHADYGGLRADSASSPTGPYCNCPRPGPHIGPAIGKPRHRASDPHQLCNTPGLLPGSFTITPRSLVREGTGNSKGAKEIRKKGESGSAVLQCCRHAWGRTISPRKPITCLSSIR